MAKKKLLKTSEHDTKNITWQTNHIKIRDAFLEVLKSKQRAPQIREVEKLTGLSDKTITKHIKTLNLVAITDKARVLSEDVLMAIFRSATKGSSASQKLWVQIVEGWSENLKIDVPEGIKVIYDGIGKPKNRKANRN